MVITLDIYFVLINSLSHTRIKTFEFLATQNEALILILPNFLAEANARLF